MNQPLVSCLLPTRGRITIQPYVIFEAIHSFVQQDYPNRELVVYNDAQNQTLVCSLSNVRIINSTERLPSLGYIYNAMVEAARGEICLPWEDDDYSLPWRIGQAVQELGTYDYWYPGAWWYVYVGQKPKMDNTGVGHNCSAYKRTIFLNAYPNSSKGFDCHAHDWAKANLRCSPRRLTEKAELSYMYMWNRSHYHHSGHSDLNRAFHDAPTGANGTYELKAETQTDWIKVHKEACQSVEL